jgi:hypothetical protein
MFKRFKKKQALHVNRSNRVLVQCKSLVDKSAVTHEVVDGKEFIRIKSKTMPDDVVMNGVFYPAAEIEKSYLGLNDTLAPFEHPSDSQGRFLSASSPAAITEFHVGAHNENAVYENGRVSVDKVIDVAFALKSEKGKRALERINELETSESPRAIHTSTGVYLSIEELSEPLTNDKGQEYSLIASDLIFDHDAMLFDSVGAAQPHQGVGMAVNAEGEEVEVQQVDMPEQLVTVPASDETEMSFDEMEEAVMDALKNSSVSASYIVKMYPSRAVFVDHSSESARFFTVSYVLGNSVATITSIPLPVDREENFKPKTNNQQSEKAMKEMIVNALKAAGVETDGLSDDQLLAEHSKLQANESSGEDESKGGEDFAEMLANALKPFGEKLDGIEAKQNATDNAKLESLAAIVGNSDKYPDLSVDDAKKLGVETLSTMAANCSTAYGIPITPNAAGDQPTHHDMPE